MIELIIVVVLLAILMAISIPKYTDLKSQAQNTVADSIVGTLNSTETIVYLKSKLDNSISYNCTTVTSNVVVTGVDSWSINCGDNKATGAIGDNTYVFLRDATKTPANWTRTH